MAGETNWARDPVVGIASGDVLSPLIRDCDNVLDYLQLKGPSSLQSGQLLP